MTHSKAKLKRNGEKVFYFLALMNRKYLTQMFAYLEFFMKK